jgi:hypothetical protein
MAFQIQFCLTISEFAIQHFANKQKRRENYSQAVGSLLFLQSSVKNNIPYLVKRPHQQGDVPFLWQASPKAKQPKRGFAQWFLSIARPSQPNEHERITNADSKGIKAMSVFLWGLENWNWASLIVVMANHG